MLQTYGQVHLQITTRDLERSVSFYKKLFGMQELRRGETSCMLRTPGSPEIFTISSNPKWNQNAGQMGGFAHFGFRLKEAMEPEAIGRAMTEAGGTLDEVGGTKEEGRIFAFGKDPDGYDVEVFWDR